MMYLNIFLHRFFFSDFLRALRAKIAQFSQGCVFQNLSISARLDFVFPKKKRVGLCILFSLYLKQRLSLRRLFNTPQKMRLDLIFLTKKKE